MVRVKGLEPPLPFRKQILSLPRLPFRHTRVSNPAVFVASGCCLASFHHGLEGYCPEGIASASVPRAFPEMIRMQAPKRWHCNQKLFILTSHLTFPANQWPITC